MNIVLIPVWRRPEFLFLTLKHIKQANNWANNFYYFAFDRGFDPECLDVAQDFIDDSPNAEICLMPYHPHRGNSFCVLEGYKNCLALAKRHNSQLIHMIEEDILIGKDYFHFHESVQAKYEVFCVSACRNQNNSQLYPHEPEKIYKHQSFQSLGISWKPCVLEQITKHAVTAFYVNPRMYMARNFAKNLYPDMHYEQDGLINRLLRATQGESIFPYVPIAFHNGFWGYNRQGKPLEGDLASRIHQLETMTPEEKNDRAYQYKDITPVDLNADYNVEEYTLGE